MNYKKFINYYTILMVIIVSILGFMVFMASINHSHGATLIYKSDSETSHAFVTEVTCNNNSNFVYYKSFTVLGTDYEGIPLTPGFTYHFYVKSQVNPFFQGETTEQTYDYTYKTGDGVFVDTTGDVGFQGGHLKLYSSPWE
ncbi:MAG: hypothetical protein CfClM3_0604 [Methanobrevibacter sp. CfCl-M3]